MIDIAIRLVEMPRDTLEYLVKFVPEKDHLPMALVSRLLAIVCIAFNTNRGRDLKDG